MKRPMLLVNMLVVASLLLSACGEKEVEVTHVVTEEETVIQNPTETPGVAYKDGLPPIFEAPKVRKDSVIDSVDDCGALVEEQFGDFWETIPEELEEDLSGLSLPEYICETGSWGVDDLGDFVGALDDLFEAHGDAFVGLLEMAEDPAECTAAITAAAAMCGLEIAGCILSLEGGYVPAEFCYKNETTGEEVCDSDDVYVFPGAVCLAEAGLIYDESDPCVAAVQWVGDACGLTDDE